VQWSQSGSVTVSNASFSYVGDFTTNAPQRFYRLKIAP
jgi:hypothetical protein